MIYRKTIEFFKRLAYAKLLGSVEYVKFRKFLFRKIDVAKTTTISMFEVIICI